LSASDPARSPQLLLASSLPERQADLPLRCAWSARPRKRRHNRFPDAALALRPRGVVVIPVPWRWFAALSGGGSACHADSRRPELAQPTAAT